jgi:imidazoleglycerol-phosphate dehydratase
MSERKASVTRTTERVEVKVVLNLDGKGGGTVQTGFPFLDQMLTLFARLAAFDLEIRCKGNESAPLESVADVALCLGLALDNALGERKGTPRYGQSYAPVNEHLARAVVDISGHPCLVYHVRASVPNLSGADAGVIERFWRNFAVQARLNLHIELLYGDGLPAFEAIFKAAARALSHACQVRPHASTASGD